MQYLVSKLVFRGLQITGIVLLLAGLVRANGIAAGCGLLAMVAAWLVVRDMNNWDS